MSGPYVVSVSPHIKSGVSTKRIMWAVALSLAPSGIAGAFIFGARSLFVIVASVIAALATEIAILTLRKKEITIGDGSAVLTGLLLAYNIPPGVPLWLPVVGSIFGVAIGKQIFGGLGQNVFNPALVGRAFLMVSWPVYMTTWQSPRWSPDAVTGATPLAIYKQGEFELMSAISKLDLLLGNRAGCIGEVCIATLLLGAAFLLIKKYITWHIPFVYIATVAFMSWVFNGQEGFFSGDALYFILSGGLMLGAFFMATDYVTSPLSPKGKMVFAFGCGLLTFVIRKFSGYPEGVSYSILIMNAAVPIIDRYTHPKWFGWAKKKRRGQKT